MKHIRKFESYRNNKNVVNEAILGSVINFFKGMWAKAVEEIKKLGKNPSPEQVEQWVDKNPMNPADDGYIFKPQMDEFKKKTEANEQDCLDLIQNLLDPETGCLGKQGLQTLYDGILKLESVYKVGKKSYLISCIDCICNNIVTLCEYILMIGHIVYVEVQSI